jgi:hypothetical protein
MNASRRGWVRLSSSEAFLETIADRELAGEGMRFIVHSDGRISGTVGTDLLSGQWYWEDEYFCRTAALNGEDLGLDCEVIELCGNSMRYTRNKGQGTASIVSLT